MLLLLFDSVHTTAVDREFLVFSTCGQNAPGFGLFVFVVYSEDKNK